MKTGLGPVSLTVIPYAHGTLYPVRVIYLSKYERERDTKQPQEQLTRSDNCPPSLHKADAKQNISTNNPLEMYHLLQEDCPTGLRSHDG